MMTDLNTDPSPAEKKSRLDFSAIWKKSSSFFIQSMPYLSFGFSLIALLLALSPFVIPQVRAHLISSALGPIEFEKVLTNYRTYQENLASQTRINSVKSAEAYLKNNPSLLKLEATDAVIGNRAAKTKVFVFALELN